MKEAASRNEKTDEGQYREATEDEIPFSRALGKAIDEKTICPAQSPSGYEHAKQQDIRFWLTTCKHFFDRNAYQAQDEAEHIKYAVSKPKGSKLAFFAMTYRNQMTGELGLTQHQGYES